MKLDTFYKKLARFLPLGIEACTTFHQLCAVYGIAAGFTLAAPISILGQYNNLFYTAFDAEGKGHKVLYEGMMMPMFGYLVSHWFVLFGAILLGCIAMAVLFYLYHRQDSMSIYTMRRLPRRSELHIRCLTVPIAAALAAILLAITLLALYYAFYHWLVPPQCISPDQLRFLIEQLTGGIF